MSRTIIDQFTRQAIPYSESPAITDQAALDLAIHTIKPKATDTLLDVACGPGLVALAFAAHLAHATGIDITPAMLARAESLKNEKHVNNATFLPGDVMHLPFPDDSFDIVLTRYAVHHFPDPAAVITEMSRVCRPGGTLALIDMFTTEDPAQAAAFNALEKRRDPSHARALPLSELTALLQSAGTKHARSAFYKVELELEDWLARSCTSPENAEGIRQLLEEDLPKNQLALNARCEANQIHLSIPIAILAAEKALARKPA